MTTSSSRTSFDRRDFLKASGILTIGFSMSSVAGSAGAATLRAPKSVAKETIDSWITISSENRPLRPDRDGDGGHRYDARPMANRG